jgi:hypothetical protein
MKAVKESGAKYGFRDETQFREDLPTKEIERFVGKLEILSLTFNPINNYWNDDPVNKLGVWGSVEVLMRATQKDGTRFNYRTFFDHFGGALGAVTSCQKRQTKQRSRCPTPD